MPCSVLSVSANTERPKSAPAFFKACELVFWSTWVLSTNTAFGFPRMNGWTWNIDDAGMLLPDFKGPSINPAPAKRDD
jgi:hypothetical protein